MNKFMDRKQIELTSDRKNRILRSGDKMSFKADKALNPKGRHRLFFTAEDVMFPFLKDEPFGEKLYMLIDDSLDTKNAMEDRFCLDMSCKKSLPYMKMCAKKLEFPLKYGIYEAFGYSDIWNMGIYAKTNNLKIEKDGFLRMRADIHYKKEGTDPRFTGNEPDEIVCIDICDTKGNYAEFAKLISLDTDSCASILISIEGKGYSGEVYFERPHFTSQNLYNLLPPFDLCVSKLSDYSWTGLNLSKKEWAEFKISVNGTELARREFFLAIHRFPVVELDIPSTCILAGDNEITIEYLSCYHDTVPLKIGEVLILESDSEDVDIIYCPDILECGGKLNLLAECNILGAKIKLEDCDFSEGSDLELLNTGLEVLSFIPKTDADKLMLKLDISGKKHQFEITTVPKRCDGIICGSGDAVYVDMSNTKDVSDFLKWYISNELGNLITIRPVYRWGGQRYINPQAYELFCRICTAMEISYVNLSDGRDLPGICQNPPEDMIDGEYFLGKQLHERDGQLLYWGVSPRENDPASECFFDIALRLFRDNPKTTEGAYRPSNVIIRDGAYSFRRDLICTANMKLAHDTASKAISDLCTDNFKRHTGPSVAFKYFYENGFDFLGAETMDGAFEPLLAFLRGASDAYGKKRYGVHHALQWSTSPHDCEKRYRRYMLALYLSYMHGVTDINTEEGFRYFEARYSSHNRLSEACEKHRQVERDFYKFVRTHNRTGEFYTNTAFIHGRYDGWDGFCRNIHWGMPNLCSGDEASAWKLLKIFYPLCKIEADGMRKMGYVSPDEQNPVGYFSGNPRGNVNCIPIENSDFSKYKLLCFAGYNYADKNDFDALLKFVIGGGTLICTWAHLCQNLNPQSTDILNLLYHPLVSALTDGLADFGTHIYKGQQMSYCKNISKSAKPICLSDDGIALAYSVEFGSGRIAIVNTNMYPGSDSVFELYCDTVKKFGDIANESEDYKVYCGNDVAHTIYKNDDGSIDFYFTATDWYNDSLSPRRARLTLGANSYDLELDFGKIYKIKTKDEKVYTEDF